MVPVQLSNIVKHIKMGFPVGNAHFFCYLPDRSGYLSVISLAFGSTNPPFSHRTSMK